MSLEQVRLSQDADQARRLQALLAFKEQFISQTMAAQVIGSSGSELSRSVYIDKGEHDGIKPDMAVITADGIVGKVLRVYRSTSLVLLIDDQTSGVGSILDKTRLQGILRGTPSGELVLEKVMSDETVSPGELVLTSGGDGIFPKGLLVGRVTKASPGSELFLNIRVHPAVDLSKLEEVLVVTKIDERQAQPDQTGAARAVDILAERLPGVPSKPETGDKTTAPDATKSAPPIATTVTTTKSATTKPAPTTTTTTAPGTASSKPAVPANPDSGNKTTAPPPQVSVNGDPAPPRKTATSSSASFPAPSAGTTAAAAMKTVSKPVKASTEPKPQPTLEDNPH
jgi:rod shape-determining protein MreC